MLNIINNLPEALTPAELPDCLMFLHFAHYRMNLRPRVSFACGRGDRTICVGDDLGPDKRWWARRPRGDRQRMLPFPEYARVKVLGTYTGGQGYCEFNVERMPTAFDSYGRECQRTLVFQPGERIERNTIRAIRIHDLSSRQIRDTLGQLGWL